MKSECIAAVALAATICAMPSSATVYEVNVPTGSVQTNFTVAQVSAIAALGANDEVQKTGGGRLVVVSSTDIKSFKGTIRISDGVYEATSTANNISGVFGTKDGPTIVEDGATLDFTAWISDANGGIEEFVIAGKGYGNMGGAIVATSGYNVNLGRMTLAADATVINPSGSRLSFSLQPVDMNGHTLKMVGLCNFQPTAITDPGHVIFDGNGVVCYTDPPQKGDYPGGPENTITYTNGYYAICQTYPHTNKVYWTLRMADTATSGSSLNLIYSGNGAPATAFNWYGPVELAGSKATFSSKEDSLHFHGPIKGGADLIIKSQSVGYVFFHGTNTYTGKLDVSGGRLVPMTEESLPGWDGDDWSVTGVCSSTSYAIYPASTNAANPHWWKPERIGQLFRKIRTKGSWNIGLYAAEGEETVCELPEFDLSDVNYFGQYLFTLGKGRKVVKGDYPDGFRIYSPYGNVSNLVYSSKNPETANFIMGQFNMRNESHIRFENMGCVLIGGYPYIGYNENRYCTCIVGTNTIFGVTYDSANKLLSKGLYVSSGANRHAAAWILPGAILSNGLWVGAANVYTNSCGMLVQKGGFVSCTANRASFGEARWGMGYYELAGGRIENNMIPYFGLFEGSCGHMWQTGGEFLVSPAASYVWIGGEGTGLVHVAGGTFKSEVPVYAPKSYNNSDRTDGCGRFSVGNGARPLCEAGVRLGDRINSVGMVDLTGEGVLETKEIVKREKTSQGSVSTGNAKAYVNFNGGGVCAISNNVELLGTGNSAVDRATVYAAGAILEVAEGISASISVPLQAATGGGVASLALPAEPFNAYHCAPLVFIYGDGTGAEAIVEYDSDNDVITNIVVTSPGWGYTAENTTAVLHWCGNVNRPDVPLTVTVAENAAGGVTKRGPGRIALTAANTYGGATVVEGGILAAMSADAIPSGSPVTVKAGGVLELGAGVGYPADITADVDCEDRTRRYALISCPDGSPAGAPAVKGLDPGWVVKQRGTMWTASYQHGAVFSVR